MSITYYDSLLSGHAHRPRALLKLLGVEHEVKIVNLPAGEHKQADFLALNPLGQVPVLTDGDVTLRDSTAILVYLASKYDANRTWLPTDPATAGLVQEWLATSTKDLFLGAATARISKVFAGKTDEAAVANAEALFDTLFEPHLAKHDWLVGNGPTIADLANYSYIALAGEAEIDISRWPAIAAWVKRLEALPGFDPVPAAADVMAAG